MKFFITHPKFAVVIAILITLIGALSAQGLPIGRYPDVAPPTVEVYAVMDGADASIVSKVIAPTIEQRVNGVDGMQYMKSTSNSDGSYSLEVTFDLGVDPDKAVTLVQNRVNTALPELPPGVVRNGVTVEKITSGMIMGMAVYDPTGEESDIAISGFAGGPLKESLQRVAGVSKVDVLGEKKYAMRVWTDPIKLAKYRLNITDIQDAILEQNRIASAGRIIGELSEYTLSVKGGLDTAEEFENIIVRADFNSQVVRLKDVARVELGAETYIANAYMQNQDGAIIFIYRSPDANAMEVGEGVKQVLANIQAPGSIEIPVIYDTTEFIGAAIDNVIETLVLAVLIVSLVTLVFMQSWRTTLITVAAIPVSLIGTFSIMQACNININIVSMFGLVLAIGIVVDAAIIVVENIERILHEQPDCSVEQAVELGSQQVITPVIASALVLLSVFAPTLFLSGMTGIIYSEFGIVLSASVVVSTLVALTLTPAMASLMIKRERKGLIARVLEMNINAGVNGLTWMVRAAVRIPLIFVALFVAMNYYTYDLGSELPHGLIPNEDTSTVFVAASFDAGTALQQTDQVTADLVEQLKAIEGVKGVVSGAGLNLITSAPEMNSMMMVLALSRMDERSLSDVEIAEQVSTLISEYEGLNGFAFTPPAIPDLGLVDGVEFVIKDHNNVSAIEMGKVVELFIADVSQAEQVDYASTQYQVNKPSIELKLDRLKIKQHGLNIDHAIDALQSYTGGMYVNTFNMLGRNYRVMIQNDKHFNEDVEKLGQLQVAYKTGVTVPLSKLFSVEQKLSPTFITRHNAQQAVAVTVIPSVSTGEAMKAINSVALPEGFSIEYTGISKQEIETGNAALYAFGMALLITFLVLVAQYESWSIPTIIMLTVPCSLIGIIAGVNQLGGDVNLLTQIAAILLVGMTVRNAILIVEFAKDLRENQSLSIAKAAVEAVRLRTRAVMMTALSFAVGVLPLMFADGIGHGGQNAIGFASFGGIASATAFGIIFSAVFFIVIQSLREKFKGKP
ncbi:efflux RND transporter permease subunit [Motilimonas pumila]|uniref:Efflux RND transporter permease subunit n=1 Tax=Motilimonas pumila TaxID=2303987 RepID=A0A418YIM1_9GAMM|nr:efflux RND transporter permease subunit [Motilimonas pumila]RJG50495.1 efflux RND transporter permease subunit [Motilimonas pumila]